MYRVALLPQLILSGSPQEHTKKCPFQSISQSSHVDINNSIPLHISVLTLLAPVEQGRSLAAHNSGTLDTVHDLKSKPMKFRKM